MVGSAAALGPEDIITCQYRETGVFLQRGYTLQDFMSQLVHNKNDPGKGRNMPCHYSGRVKTGVVGGSWSGASTTSGLMSVHPRLTLHLSMPLPQLWELKFRMRPVLRTH